MTRGNVESDGAVLLALWRARSGEITMQQMLHETGLPLVLVQEGLELLSKKGCRIERSPAGVRLVTTGLGCWADLLESTSHDAQWQLGGRVMVYSETTSTNDIAWQQAARADAHGLVVLANHQTAGRGRLGHAWQARPGQSILMSMVLRGIPAHDMDRLTLLAGLATARGIESAVRDAQAALPQIEIKWPNDLLIMGRKLAGILVEARRLSGSEGAVETAVVGIGVNVLQAPGDFPEDLGGRGISIFEGCGLMVDRLRLIVEIIAAFNAALASENSDWLSEWKQRCGMLGTRVTCRSGERQITGQILDVAPEQGLLVRDDQGVTHFLSARTCTLS